MFKPKTKQCQNCKNKFTIEPEDFEFYKKIDVPAPTFCPECRMQRRMNFHNEQKIYKRKCDSSGKEIFSQFSQEAPIKIYDRDIWWSDKWDAMEYAQEYNFNKSFFKQIDELIKEVPWPSFFGQSRVNSDYATGSFLKNAYLIFGSAYVEDSAYGFSTNHIKDSYDNSYLEKCELCYQGFMLINCYKTFYSSHCDDCQELIFCSDCVGCQNCFGCTNLRHKKYHIFNKPYSKKDYLKKIEDLNIGSFSNLGKLKERVKQHHLQFPVKFMHGRKNNNVTGEYIEHSKNAKNCFLVKNSEDVRYCQSLSFAPGSHDCYDYTSTGLNARFIYESMTVSRGVNRVKFSASCYPDCRNLEYCLDCISSANLFGCVGLHHKKYCILNKQYTEKKYKELVSEIKKHMNEMSYTDKKGRVYKYGEFFPIELSPHAYNGSFAQEYVPLTKKQALERGYSWRDKPKTGYKPTLKASDLPDNIKDVDKNILKEVIECDSKDCHGTSVFRIIPGELKFYQKYNLPLPRLCPDCRHRERIKQRNPLKLWKRKCMCAGEHSDPSTSSGFKYKNTIEHKHKDKHCPNEFQTTYSPDRKEIVYCEKCYNKEVG